MHVIKIGGNELDDPNFVMQLGQVVAALKTPTLLVHGGGKEIKALQERLGLKAQSLDGLRVTDPESLAVVEMVLAGRVNKRLVASFVAAGVDAFGLSGVDRAALQAEKLSHPQGDLGQVGRITSVRREVFSHLLAEGITPVLSPLCYGPEGTIFNVNADHVAVAVAKAMPADELVFVSNVPGVLRQGLLLPHLTTAEIEALIADKIIINGMIPKVRSAVEAVTAGVRAVRITNLAGLKAGLGTVVMEQGKAAA